MKKLKEKYNRITMFDFEIESTTENLDKIKEVMDKLIKEHSKFIETRKEKRRQEEMFG